MDMKVHTDATLEILDDVLQSMRPLDEVSQILMLIINV
jgi:hypothetical protein